MDFRYFIDAETDEPHIDDHRFTEEVVEFVLRHSGEDRPEAIMRDMRWAKLRPGDTCV